MDTIRNLNDPQSELLLLRNCSGVSKLYFTMRTTQPQALQLAQIRYDTHLLQYLQHIVTGDGAGFGLLQQCIATLPIKHGGLGIYTMFDTIPYCYLASQLQTLTLQRTILNNTTVPDSNLISQQVIQQYLQVCVLPSSEHHFNETAPHTMKSLEVPYFEAVVKKIPETFAMTERDSILWQCKKPLMLRTI